MIRFINDVSGNPGFSGTISGHTLEESQIIFCNTFLNQGISGISSLNFEGSAVFTASDNGEIFLHRGKNGRRSLFYLLKNDSFHWSSLEKNLTCFLDIKRPDPDSMMIFLKYGYLPEYRTFYAETCQILPGQTIILDDNTITEQSPSHFIRDNFCGSFEEACSHLRNLLAQVVSEINPDNSLHLLLSGGIDSSAVAAVSVLCGKKVAAHTLSFSAAEHDETEYALSVSRHLGITWKTAVMTSDDFMMIFTSLIRKGMLIRSQGQMALIHLLVKSGLETLFLNGAASDEGLFGYDYLCDLLRRMHRQKAYQTLFPEGIHRYIPSGSMLKHIWDEELKEVTSHNSYLQTFFSDNELADMFQRNFPEEIKSIPDKNDFYSSLTDFQYQELLPAAQYPRMNDIENFTRCSVRSPFSDWRIRQFFDSLPLSWKFCEGKRKIILTEAMRSLLPEKVICRTKAPFMPPLKYFIEDNRGFFLEFLKSESVKAGFCLDPEKLFSQTSNLGYRGYERILLTASVLNFLNSGGEPCVWH